MDKVLTANFDRVEKALTTLVNSIANYTANPLAAVELVKADSELVDGLKLLNTHQKNHATILAKRAHSALLDAQIRDTISLLASTRAELIATPATTFPDPPSSSVTSGNNERWPLEYRELLGYAKRIAKTSMPPGGYRGAGKTNAGVNGTAGQGVVEGGAVSTGTSGSVGLQTPPAGTTSPAVPAAPLPSTTSSNAPQQQSQAAGPQPATNSKALPEDWHMYIHPHEWMPWVPWPTDHQIRSGQLASLQFEGLSGEADPGNAGVGGVVEVGELEEARRRDEVERARVGEVNEKVGTEGQVVAQVQAEEKEKAQAPPPQQQIRREQAQKFEGLSMLDDDDEEED